MRVLHVLGARPNYIKCATVFQELAAARVSQAILETGQHYDYNLSKVFIKELGIPEPFLDLCIGSDNQCGQVGRTILGLEPVFAINLPDVVIVYGDTNSTLGATIAAVKMDLPVVHVEAGARAWGLRGPEETNRVLVDRVSRINCCATVQCKRNLVCEGLADTAVFSGDVLYDLHLRTRPSVVRLRSKLFEEHGLKVGNYVLATVHRAQNTDDQERLINIFLALMNCGKDVVLPIHPRTEKALAYAGLLDEVMRSNLLLLPPQGYFEFSELLLKAGKVVTDSGGVQKEAYFYRKPCITVNDVSHWPETVSEGWNIVAGANRQSILKALREFEAPKAQKKIFGDGRASHRIAVEIIDVLDTGC